MQLEKYKKNIMKLWFTELFSFFSLLNYDLSCLGELVLSEAGDWAHDVNGETQTRVKGFICSAWLWFELLVAVAVNRRVDGKGHTRWETWGCMQLCWWGWDNELKQRFKKRQINNNNKKAALAKSLWKWQQMRRTENKKTSLKEPNVATGKSTANWSERSEWMNQSWSRLAPAELQIWGQVGLTQPENRREQAGAHREKPLTVTETIFDSWQFSLPPFQNYFKSHPLRVINHNCVYYEKSYHDDCESGRSTYQSELLRGCVADVCC